MSSAPNILEIQGGQQEVQPDNQAFLPKSEMLLFFLGYHHIESLSYPPFTGESVWKQDCVLTRFLGVGQSKKL